MKEILSMTTRTTGWQMRALFQFKDDLRQKLKRLYKKFVRTFSSAQVHELRQHNGGCARLTFLYGKSYEVSYYE